MKKVGIMTIYRADNCGAVLQALALQTCIRRQGLACEVINYATIVSTPRFYGFSWTLRGIASGFRFFLLTVIPEARKCRLFNRFRRQHLVLSKSYRSLADLEEAPYDTIVVGSDQIWNPEINKGDKAYLLAFGGASIKRIAYAPSLAGHILTKSERRLLAGALACYSHVSARERDGAEQLAAILDQSVPVLLDPTLLLTAEDYGQFEWADHRKLTAAPYICCYCVGFYNHKLVSIAESFGKQLKLRIVYLCNEVYQAGKFPGQFREVAAPDIFLTCIRHAFLVVTNSYHGSVFSIIYRRPFYVMTRGAAATRMNLLLSTLGISDRIISGDGDVLSFCSDSDIDYVTVGARLDNLRTASLHFLNTSLSGD